MAVSGANTHDKRLVEETLLSVPVEVPYPDEAPRHLCLDAGFDNAPTREVVAAHGYVGHIRPARPGPRPRRRPGRRKARRWVVERTHSWMNRFRRVLVRWEKKAENYAAMLQLACAFITYAAAGVLG